MELPWLSAAMYQLIYCTAWASPSSGASFLLLSSAFPLGYPNPRLQVLSTTAAMMRLLRLPGVEGASSYPCLSTCVPSFSLGVLASWAWKKSLQTIKWKYSAMKKNCGSGLPWFVLS